jgi:hypothetical protein
MQNDVEQRADNMAKGKSWWQACLIGCSLLFIAVLVSGYFILQFLTGPPAQSLTSLPKDYPADLPLFQIEKASSITLVSGRSRSMVLDIFSAPVKLLAKIPGNTTTTGAETQKVKDILEGYSSGLKNSDSVTVTWKNLEATRQALLEYYGKLFKSAGMTVKVGRDEFTATDLIDAARQNAMVQLLVRDHPETPLLDEVTAVIDYQKAK